MEYQDNEGNTISGSSFVGRALYGRGVFLFLEPDEGDKFEANPGANAGYFEFCNAIGIECPTTKIEVDGEEKEVKQLPTLSKDDLIGKPLLGKLKSSKYKDRDGNYQFTVKVMEFYKWEDGVEKLFDEDIPF